eukprot:CAMPEP_0170588644 /NCGR_PEP_ID=MMETSP0224-20130122/10941_1 /TAXON_ID=285029 /ORGANISM="Togula jolla, Strain CCCM 725" /LENGTH=611 /DNA_ID=CAMNT_0010912377 /DNA_START=24 /DNA_END=1859 /DNA_ORIENTATION=+
MGTYLLLLLSVGIFAYRAKRVETTAVSASAAHFGGSYNPVFLILTTLASIYSGYTVTGIPAEAYRDGFTSLRWLPGALVIALAHLLFAPRLRRIAVERSYMSPNDFIKDRFRSPLLTLMCTVFMCVPQVFYSTAQFASFASTLSGLTLGAVDLWVARAMLGGIILLLELTGGMKSVVLSDVIQAFLMIAGFVLLPSFVMGYYGSFGSLGSEFCSNCFYVSTNLTAGECPATCEAGFAVADHCQLSGCLPQVPQLYDYPDWTKRCEMLFFIGGLLFFPLNPHMVQRIYIARNDQGFRLVLMVLFVMPFLAAMPGIITGIAKKTVEGKWPLSSQKSTAFAGMCVEIMRKGAFEYGVVSVLNCAALAAIMSTADSVILGVSSTVSFDVFRDILRPQATEKEIVRVGLMVSAIMVIASFVYGFYLVPADFGTFLTIQNGLLGQAAPAYLAGLWMNVSARSVTIGCSAGLSVFAIMFIYSKSVDDGVLVRYVPDIFWGLGANIIVLFGCHCISPDHDSGDDSNQRWGSRLTQPRIAELMEDTQEPSYWVVPVILIGIVLALPWWGASGDDMSAGAIDGIPEWAVFLMVMTGVLCALGVYGAWTWIPINVAKKGQSI